MFSQRPLLWRLFLLGALALPMLLSSCGGGVDEQTVNPPGGGSSQPVELVTETVVSGVSVPWSIVFAPDGRIFFTEQRGRLRVISANGQLLPAPAMDVVASSHGGEAGMLGLEIDPDFQQNGFLYVFYCYRGSSPSGIRCKLARLVMTGDTAREERVLLDTEGGIHHNAGRVKIGPDGMLYLAIGDIHDVNTAQDLSKNAGKILRMTREGAPAAGNPFPQNPLVYAYGLRDPQGIAWDSSGALYATEHGDESNDEVNLITAGGNYGWPVCQGRCNNPQFTDPVKLFHPETPAPSGATFYSADKIPQWNGSLLFATMGLADNSFAKHIHRIRFDRLGGTNIVEEEVLYRGEFGRIRDVVQGPDGFVYFSTSNGQDDRIVRIRPR